jgi:LAO/AO transport system kinase
LNKADHAGADAMEAALRSSLAFRPAGGWKPPIVRTVATERKGIEAMHEALLQHREHISTPEHRDRDPAREGAPPAPERGARGAVERVALRPAFEKALEEAAERVLRGDVSPHRAARDLTERIARQCQGLRNAPRNAEHPRSKIPRSLPPQAHAAGLSESPHAVIISGHR